jgi:endogenous inhibitor of DNA gyrase (YacG/DUF329 family)
MVDKAPHCPICKRLTTEESHPFCSERCRQIDLGQWLDGKYRIEADRHEQSASDDTETGNDS